MLSMLYMMYIFAIYATCLGLKSNKLGAAQPSLAWEERRVIGMDFPLHFIISSTIESREPTFEVMNI